MMKIGLVGEDPNDTTSIANILRKKYKGITYVPLAKRIVGSQLDNPKVKRALAQEVEAENYKFIIYVRDLDGFHSENDKVNSRLEWFEELNHLTGNTNILLLNVWELEALI